MKKLRELQGGYPRQQDYLLALQNELYTAVESQFGALSVDMVLKGCEVTDNGNGTVNIAEGLVYCSGEICRFSGASNIAIDGTKTFVKDVATTSSPKTFGDGSVKDVYSEVFVIIGTKTTAAQIAIKTTLYNFSNYIDDRVFASAFKGEIKDVYDFDGTFLDNFDASGLGSTPRFSGWALLNGNNATPNGQGRVRITVGSIIDNGVEYDYTNGQIGGETKHKLTIAEMPAHNHAFKKVQTQGSGTTSGYVNGASQGEISKNTENTGGDQPHENRQPFLAVYSIIKIV
ncbi:MAG: hypothetical protein IE931_05480 [Sphingobacteriales bacterium]|nr:hypothetical protein [Sphingobacteriales bacterium]